MNEKSTFRVIGICYNDTKYFKSNNGLYAYVVLVVKTETKNRYIPITAYGDKADLLIRLARNGNLVAVSGYIDSSEMFDKSKGLSQIRISFVMEDIMVLSKMSKTRLTDKRIDELLDIFNLE